MPGEGRGVVVGSAPQALGEGRGVEVHVQCLEHLVLLRKLQFKMADVGDLADCQCQLSCCFRVGTSVKRSLCHAPKTGYG